ncbi:hypothetical protein P9D34_01640 [Bacillus swezeyi]|nr:hypothetical protein [Bacillus swezeyi]MEC1259162.1 hypothetical protein [Bacillus swezeyi]MED1740487.1 hypothetical protein [Bacillus swezeyi]MED2927877.1 hypothetical protein [Bacillus swezeyi]MED2965211.1 hypothetical protein [Bacillus swezeyi]MED3071472.1 hypothetical protein [Bacillus swezeyi]
MRIVQIKPTLPAGMGSGSPGYTFIKTAGISIDSEYLASAI